MNQQKISYRKVRDLGAIFSATFGFIKRNFKPLYGSLLYFAGPFLLVGAVISSSMMGSMFSLTSLAGRNPATIYGELALAYLTTILVMFIGITIYNVILNRNLLENEQLGEGESLSVKHGIRGFWGDFWRVLANTLLLIILFIVGIVVIALIVAGIIALADGSANSGGTIVLGILAVLLFLVVIIIFGPIMAFIPISALFVCQRDKVSIFEALGKVFYYMRGNFWSTWVVSMVGLLTYSVMHMVVQIPILVITMVTAFSRIRDLDTAGGGSTSVLLVIATAISTLLGYGVMVFYHLLTVYQFTNLEEKKEGSSIIEKIQQIQ